MGFSRRDSGGFGGRGGRGGRGGFGDRGGRRDGFRSGGDREMFAAVCDECGKECKVPFKPSSDKPIYCSECFEKKGGNESRSDRRGSFDRAPREFSRERSFDFSKPQNPENDKKEEQFRTQVKEQLSAINAKFDKILRSMEPVELEERDPE